jgi:HAD superfamily hydrolase (TIGR01484 family)
MAMITAEEAKKKRVFFFDQDDTVNHGSKQNIDSIVAKLWLQLVDSGREVALVTGTNWEAVKRVSVDAIEGAKPEQLAHLHMMPTTGTQYWRFGIDGKNEWDRQYADFLTDEQAEKVMKLLEDAARKLGYWVELDPAKDKILENRGSQITYSALGQWADPTEKKKWDSDHKKRKAIIAEIMPELKAMDLEVAIGGATSIDVTLPGIDKGYAVRKFLSHNPEYKIEDCVFIGDMLEPGGNDYPVIATGIDTIKVKDCGDTARILEEVLAA